MIESRVVKDKEKYRMDTITVWDREFLEHEAKFVMEFIVRWGAVCAMPDGEDSSGKQKLRPMTPEELVEKALASTKLAFDRIRKEGWIHITESLPEPPKRDTED